MVYLPPGPSIQHGSETTPPEDVLAYLQATVPPTPWLVTINYRLGATKDSSESIRFPVPVHDVATAFEFLISSTSPFNHDQDDAPKVCLFGSHIGGALATMLALTEPNNVHALATIEAVVDWVGLDEVVEHLLATESRRKQRHKTAGRYGVNDRSVLAAAEELIKLRARLFGTPSAYFDPFASPLLFLRAPGRDTPLSSTVGDRLVSEMGLDQNDGGYTDYDSVGGFDNEATRSQSNRSMSQPSESSNPSTTGSEPMGAARVSDEEAASPTKLAPPPRRRKVLRRWPAVGNPESVLLPHVGVFVQDQLPADAPTSEGKPVNVGLGLAALMRAQGTELAELMRRACFLGRERGFADARVLLHGQGGGPGNDVSKKSTEHASFSGHGSEGHRTDLAEILRSNAVHWVRDMFQQE